MRTTSVVDQSRPYIQKNVSCCGLSVRILSAVISGCHFSNVSVCVRLVICNMNMTHMQPLGVIITKVTNVAKPWPAKCVGDVFRRHKVYTPLPICVSFSCCYYCVTHLTTCNINISCVLHSVTHSVTMCGTLHVFALFELCRYLISSVKLKLKHSSLAAT